MTFSYRHLLADQSFSVCESSQEGELFSEKHLQVMWFEQKYFRNLKTRDGEEIEVLSPGIWNGEAGPDFMKARLRIGDAIVDGDVELHLWESSWVHHGHRDDPRYNNVVLHVVYWPAKKDEPTLTQSGLALPVAYVEPSVTLPLRRIVQLIDLDLYPYKQFVGSGRCASQLFQGLSQDETERLFRSAAHWRLEQKLKFLRTWAEKPFDAGLAMALGYKQNSQAFLELYLYLKDFHCCGEQELLSVAMGICGFFEERYSEKWGESSLYRQLESFWFLKRSEVTHQTQLQLNSTRPLNHPIRRLVYLAKFMSDPSAQFVPTTIFSSWQKLWPAAAKPKDWRALLNELSARIPDYEDAFWNQHYSFHTGEQQQHLALMGQDLKLAILLNTGLPILYEEVVSRGDAQELEAFTRFYAQLRASASGKAKYLRHRFFGDDECGTILKKADMQQGAYQLHRDFCTHYEASCEGCPFVERALSLRSRRVS